MCSASAYAISFAECNNNPYNACSTVNCSPVLDARVASSSETELAASDENVTTSESALFCATKSPVRILVVDAG